MQCFTFIIPFNIILIGIYYHLHSTDENVWLRKGRFLAIDYTLRVRTDLGFQPKAVSEVHIFVSDGSVCLNILSSPIQNAKY